MKNTSKVQKHCERLVESIKDYAIIMLDTAGFIISIINRVEHSHNNSTSEKKAYQGYHLY